MRHAVVSRDMQCKKRCRNENEEVSHVRVRGVAEVSRSKILGKVRCRAGEVSQMQK